MRLGRGRTVEALVCAEAWSADTADGVADLPWAGTVTGGQVRCWLAALHDLGWRPPDRVPVTVAHLAAQAFGAPGPARTEPQPPALVRGLRFDPAAYRPPIDGRRWR